MNRLREFWSAYSRNIIRFWTNQLVMSFLGISVGLATIALKNEAVSALGSGLCIGILCFMQYDNLFQLGEKHHFRPADANRPAKSLGLKIALLGSCPLLLVILLGLLVSVVASDDVHVIFMLIHIALHGSYLYPLTFLSVEGTIGWLGGPLGWLVCLLFLLPEVLFAGLGYLLGSKDRPLRTFFGIRYGKKGE